MNAEAPKSKSQERREAIMRGAEQEYNFPALGVTITASSLEEAEAKAAELEKKQAKVTGEEPSNG